MTFPVQTPQRVYIGDNVTTAFAFNFEVPTQPDNTAQTGIEVWLITPGSPTTVVEKALTTDYTLTGAGVEAGGTVTMLVAPPTGSILVIKRAVDLAQDTTFPNQGWLAVNIESSFDLQTMMLQQATNTALADVVTVASLPNANTQPFKRRFVTDATLTLTAGVGTVVAGGGTHVVPVHSDCVNWRIG